MKHLIGFLAVLLCCQSFKVNAQEKQIPLDSNGKIGILDSKLEQKLGLFSEYPNFMEARLFQINDTSYVLEVYYRPGRDLLKNRWPLSLEGIRTFRQKVSSRLAETTSHMALDQDGRSQWIAGLMALSLGYYGWAVPASLDVDNGKVGVALYMLTGSAGFYIPYSATRNRSVTDAAATLSLYGGSRGIAHGIVFASLVDNEPAERGVLASGMLFSMAESFAGFQLANRLDLSSGTSEVMGVVGDFGMGLGFGTAHLFDFYDQENGRAIATSVLAESGLGMWAGYRLACQQPYTRGDARVLSAAGLLGAYLPLALVDVSGTDNKKIYTAASMAGSVAGLGFGQHLVKDKDFSTGQGNLVQLGQLAGGLLGLGAAYLVTSQNQDNSILYLTASAVGAATGFWLMVRSFEQTASVEDENLSIQVHVNPAGVLRLATGRQSSAKTSPLLQVNCVF